MKQNYFFLYVCYRLTRVKCEYSAHEHSNDYSNIKVDTNWIRLCLEPPSVFKGGFETIVVDKQVYMADHAYIGVIKYRVGDNCGITNGCNHIVGVFLTEEEAYANIKKVKQMGEQEEYSLHCPWGNNDASLIGHEIVRLSIVRYADEC
jgi:hypothetical protein